MPDDRSRPEPGELVWLIHPQHGLKNILGFVRDHHGRAYIFGGHTGSHYTGHGESWGKKMAMLEDQGYLSLQEARSGGWVPENWQPPIDEAEKDVIIAKIREGIL